MIKKYFVRVISLLLLFVMLSTILASCSEVKEGPKGEKGDNGITPLFRMDENEIYISYDQGKSWTSLGALNSDEIAGGKDGKDGEDGKDGANGKDGIDGKTPLLQIDKTTNEWQVSYDNGKNWSSLGVKATGKDGEDGKDGVNGKDGKDGISIKSVEFDADGQLVIILSDGTKLPPVDFPLVEKEEAGATKSEVLLFSEQDSVIDKYVSGNNNSITYSIAAGRAHYFTYQATDLTEIQFPAFTGIGTVSVFVLKDNNGGIWSSPSYSNAQKGGSFSILKLTGKKYFTGTVYFNVFTDGDYPTKFTMISESKVAESNFSDLTYVAFGDSITYGIDGSIKSGQPGYKMTNPYPTLVKNILNIGTINNQAVSGASFCPCNGRNNMTEKILKFKDKADIISLMLGVNDFWSGLPLGDPTCKDNSTIYGSLYLISEYLTTEYPDAFIFYITPFTCKKNINSAGYYLNDVADAIKFAGAKYGIPVLDMYTYGKYESEMNSSSNDGIHPSQQHHITYTAPLIADFISNNYK